MTKQAPKLENSPAAAPAFLRPLHRRIYFSLRDQILQGEFHDDERLPSSRILAKSLRVSRNTVLAAYDRLADHGYVIARIGSGTRIRMASARLTYVAVKSATPIQNRRKLAGIFNEAHYPLRHVRFHDRDGNSLYVYDPH